MRRNSDRDLRDLERRYLEATSHEDRDQVFTKAAQVSRRLGVYPSCEHCLVFLEWKDGLCRVCSPHFHRSNPDEDLRDLERRERHDPEASRRARLTRIRTGQARPSDLILMQLPEAAQVAFDRDEDWSDRIYLPHPSFAPGQPSELDMILESEGPGSPPEFYRKYYDEAYEVESSRWSYKERPAVVGETYVFSEANGVWDTIGSDERRDVDEMTVEDMYGPAPSGQPRRPRTRWLDRREWMRSWEPYDNHVLNTGNDPIGAYGLDDPPDQPWARQADRQRLAQCRLRSLLYSSTTPEEYFALVGEAGLKWCSERTGQWHHWNPRRRNSDENLRALERAAQTGGLNEQAQLLSWRLRKGELPERNVRAAALMGVPEAAFALGLDRLSPQERRDALVLLLDTSEQVYPVLWAWASAQAALRFGAGDSVCPRVLELVERWLEDPMSERAQPCRYEAFVLAEALSDDTGGDRPTALVTAATIYAALSVTPSAGDFPEPDTDPTTGQPFTLPGDLPALPHGPVLMPLGQYNLRDAIAALSLEVGTRVEGRVPGGTIGGVIASEPFEDTPGRPLVVVRWDPTDALLDEAREGSWPLADLARIGPSSGGGGVRVPMLSTRVPAFPSYALLDAMIADPDRVPTLTVRPDVAVAATAHLAAVWSLVVREPNYQVHTDGVTRALEAVSSVVADLVRARLLGPLYPFRQGREVLTTFSVMPAVIEHDPGPYRIPQPLTFEGMRCNQRRSQGPGEIVIGGDRGDVHASAAENTDEGVELFNVDLHTTRRGLTPDQVEEIVREIVQASWDSVQEDTFNCERGR